MSHFVKCVSKMNSLELINKALTRLGIKTESENSSVSAYGKTEEVALLLDKGDSSVKGALGLSLQKDGTYSIVGDPYHCLNAKLRKYYGHLETQNQELNTAYSIEQAIKSVEDVGFSISENVEGEVSSDGLIHMVAISYGE